MTHTIRKTNGGLYTETKRVVDGEVRVVSCCCAAPGSTRKGCSIVAGNRGPCSCQCHKRS